MFFQLGSECTQGSMYNMVAYLLNEFVEDCREALDKGQLFHYSWLLILIVMEAWKALNGEKFPRVGSNECGAVRYMNLSWNRDKQK